MGYVQGRPLSPDIKHKVVAAKCYFDRHRKDYKITNISSVELVAHTFEIGVSTVRKIIADYNKDPALLERPPVEKGRPSHVLGGALETHTREYIRRANRNGQHITLETIREFIESQSPGADFHLATLARTLDRWGFSFGKGTRTQHLKEKDNIIAARRRYLRKIRSNRSKNESERRPEVYLDESYVNKNHSNDLTWYSDEDGSWIQKPTGKGERLIIMDAITIDGWVTGSRVVFKSTKKTGDYHGQMNWDLFSKWFKERLLPNIPPKSLIVMDNAKYHNILSEHSAPTSNCSKQKIKHWLENNRIMCRDDALKVELVEILKKLAPEPTYALDEIAEKAGHQVLRTPPYHPELQPIEICWGVVKNHVARNCNFTLKGLEKQIELGFQKVTPETCRKAIEKCKTFEKSFWYQDDTSDEASF